MPICKTSIQDLESIFTALGIQQGDVVMLHSAIFTLGYIEDGLVGLYRALRRRLGKAGLLIVPTFSYSFRRGEVFDARHTPAAKEIGVFAEFVRTLPGAVRSLDPLFSMAAIGPNATGLMERTNHHCFGPGSIYEKIFSENTLFVALGITYSTGLSAFMHLERMAGVDYRCDMRFDGVSMDINGNRYEDYAIHFARNKEHYPEARTNRDLLGQRMEALRISKAVDFGFGHHFALRSRPFADFVISELARDPHVMLVRS